MGKAHCQEFVMNVIAVGQEQGFPVAETVEHDPDHIERRNQ